MSAYVSDIEILIIGFGIGTAFGSWSSWDHYKKKLQEVLQ